MACRVGTPDSESTESDKRPSRRRFQIVIGCLVFFLVVSVAVPIFYKLESEPPPESACAFNLSVPIDNFKTYKNGTLVDLEGKDVYPAGYYFRTNSTVRGCLCELKPCIRKCCDKGEFLVDGPNVKTHCEPVNGSSLFDNFTLPVYSAKDTEEFADVSQEHFRILYGDVCTYGKFQLMPWVSEVDKSYLLDDGRILLDGDKLDASKYCLEEVSGYQEIQTMVCFPPPGEDIQTKAMFTMYPTGMLLSVPFLLATFLVYAVLPDLQNLHGKSLMCHVASLLSAYGVLTVVQLGGDRLPSSWCFGLAFVIQFSFLATFFWLNVMCFDIWWVFSGLRPLQGSVKEREHKKFIFYSLYAWGCPFIIFVISICMEMIPSIPDSYVKPGFGVDKCWFKDSEGLVLYFYLPVGVLVLLNVVMFVTTAFRLQVHRRETKQVLKGSESRKNDEAERQRFNLYLKLFIVMGINWVMELVSFAVGGPKSIWFVTDIGNTLQGLLIFLIFVWKRRILKLLNHKLCPRWDLVSATVTTKGSKSEKLDSAKTNITK